MIALVLAGGDLTPNARLRHLAKEASLVIAADSGLTHASALGVSPDLIVGDLNDDSIVDVLDINIVANIALNQIDFDNAADFNADGIVNILDIIDLINIIFL